MLILNGLGDFFQCQESQGVKSENNFIKSWKPMDNFVSLLLSKILRNYYLYLKGINNKNKSYRSIWYLYKCKIYWTLFHLLQTDSMISVSEKTCLYIFMQQIHSFFRQNPCICYMFDWCLYRQPFLNLMKLFFDEYFLITFTFFVWLTK